MKSDIISQYKAALAMLMDTIEKCPDDLWFSDRYANACWRIAYHAVFYTALYLSKSPGDFKPWPYHRFNYNYLGDKSHDGQLIVITEKYTKGQVIDYAKSVVNDLENLVDDQGLEERCGFEWIPLSRLGLHFYNIRHLQHHTGQLTERLHSVGISGIKWER